ncbi:hypothetical protein QR97_01810 [Streptomyces sp. PBH53]|uniref:hypothetical protein n=1 Tax=Streptomyces sp. PBH53 TaxID=1577075 RepID=UPI000656123D|nr:hypothetical protein [Streptomyces sp. PBH53]AKN68708.1 hypothetical protein QR97_01810 [Streptomyces sp. PBH53]
MTVTDTRPAPGTDTGVTLYSRAQVRTAIDDGESMAAEQARISPYADRFAWAVSAVMTLLDKPGAPWAEVKNRHYTATPDATPADDDEPQYTRDQVSQAVNNGVDLAAEHERRTYPDDVDNLVVNAALTLLDDPEADFDQVAVECYSESPRVVRSWL